MKNISFQQNGAYHTVHLRLRENKWTQKVLLLQHESDNKRPKQQKSKLAFDKIPGWSTNGKRVHFDFLGPLPEYTAGNSNVLV